jgi:uracil-DNA glycosylase
MSKIDLHPSWLHHLQSEFEAPYMRELRAFLVDEMKKGKTIFPEPKLWFNALNTTPFEDVKVVVLGQDPYPTPGHAHGLCFSVRPDVRPLPKSLINIFTELKEDTGIDRFHNGYLQGWAEQGVLLLNAVLTVEAGKPGSHQGKGWERFTDKIVEVLNEKKEGLVFVLWGSYAQKKGAVIDASKHLVLKSPHPSPLSAYRGFFGSRPFSKINAHLKARGTAPIDWSL